MGQRFGWLTSDDLLNVLWNYLFVFIMYFVFFIFVNRSEIYRAVYKLNQPTNFIHVC